MHAASELDQHGEIVVAAESRIDRDHFAKLEPHHVEHVNGSLKKKATRDFVVAGPDGLQQFATIHFDVCGVRWCFLEEILYAAVDWREPAIETDLKHLFGRCGGFEHFPRRIYRIGLDAPTRTEDYRDVAPEVKLGFAEEDRLFVDAMLGNGAPPVTALDGFRSVELACACCQSVAAKRRIPLAQ
jgi:predicted dehydrogenase